MELTQLHQRIEQRVATFPEWPCRAGCCGCCSKLAGLPRLTEAEWLHLRRGLSALPEETQRAIAARLEEKAAGPHVCRLDDAAGLCFVYEHRPVACRAYGYYVDRGEGLYCGIILEQVERGERDGVVWGNHAAVEAALAGLGRVEGLTGWWRESALPPPATTPSRSAVSPRHTHR